MRFVTLYSSVMSMDVAIKIDRLRARQKAFVKHMRTTASRDVMNLYWTPPKSNICFKETLLKIQCKDDPETQLFHSVDNGRRDGNALFHYHPRHEDEAKNDDSWFASIPQVEA